MALVARPRWSSRDAAGSLSGVSWSASGAFRTRPAVVRVREFPHVAAHSSPAVRCGTPSHGLQSRDLGVPRYPHSGRTACSADQRIGDAPRIRAGMARAVDSR